MEKDNISNDSEETPDVAAFQDEFTREFMASTDEVSDGYYLFESKTGGYTIPFPGDAHIDQIHYEKVKDSYERIMFGSDTERLTGKSYTAYVIYKNSTKPIKPDIKLSLVEDTVNYDGEFIKKEHDNVTHYFAQKKYILSDKKSSVYRFFGLVHSNNSNQLIRYDYNVTCYDESIGCDYDLDAIEQEVERVMTSVEFNN